MANAYMLLYRRRNTAVPEAAVPARLQTDALQDNEIFARLQAAFELKQTMVELEVYLDATLSADSDTVAMPAFFDLPQTTTVAEATDMVIMLSCTCQYFVICSTVLLCHNIMAYRYSVLFQVLCIV